MTTTTQPRLRKNVRSKEDVHVKMADDPNAPVMAPGEGGRYVYGIVQAKDPVTFGKVGIGGSGEMVYTVNYQDIAAVVSRWTGVPVTKLLEGTLGLPPRENLLLERGVVGHRRQRLEDLVGHREGKCREQRC